MMAGFESDAAVAVAGLSKHYGKARALDDVSFRLEPGIVHGLLGPNGSGKSTCLHSLVGLVTPTHGEIEVYGHAAGSPEARRLTGFAPDDLPLPQALTGLELLEFHDRMRDRDDLSARGLLLAESLSIVDSLDRQIAEYSHGMRRKLQLVAATMHRPALLVLDEPFRGLDPESATVLRQIIHTVPDAGGTVLIATHDMLHAEHDCTEVLILTEGRTVAQGRPAQLVDRHPGSKGLEDVFFAATGLLGARTDRLTTIAEILGDTRTELIDNE